MSETSVLPQNTAYLTRPTRPSFFAPLKRKANQNCGFVEFRRKFPELCESNAQLLNTPQTPCLPSFNTFSDSASCRLDTSANKCAKLQQPTMKTMSNSTSHPSLSNPSYKTMCSSEGSSPNAQITQVLDFVFLGSKDDAQDPETLTRNGITKVINLSDCPKSDLIQNDPHHFMRIPVKDSYDAKLIPYFDQAYEFIEEARKTNQRVLVHCLAGISRSPTLAIAYIMRAKKLNCDEAYKFVKTRRPTVSPNLNFMGQLFLYETHLRNINILPPDRPRSNVIDDYILPPTTKEINQMTVAEPPKPPMLVTEKLCKSASADFSLLSNDSNAETRRRLMDNSFSLPCRPRQLLKNCCTRKNLESQPQQLPSPSTEFSKLDISLSNPCFGTNTNSLAFDSQSQKPQTSTQINAENPVFLLDNKNDKAKAKKPSSNHHQLFNLFTRRPNSNGKLPATARIRCKLSKCYSRNSGQKPSQLITDEGNRPNGVENVRYRMPRFSRLPARNHVNIMPTLHDDEGDSGKGSSVSHSVSTEDGENQEQSGTVNSAISPTQSSTDPERDSISSASSLEIAVQ